jgi:glycosyltransferase involved in cell wall biosynthesis
MRVALILPSLANKAPIQVAKDLAAGMLLLGMHVEVFYFDDIVEVDFDCSTRRIRFFDQPNFGDFDIVHTHMLRPDAYVWFWRLIKKYKTTSFVSTIHNIIEDDLFFQYGRFTSVVFSRLWRLFWNAQDCLVVLNQAARKYYLEFLHGREVKVIHNGRALSVGKTIEGRDEASLNNLRTSFKLIGCCALLTHRKGIDQIIRVLPHCKDYALVVVGDGQVREELESLATKLGVMDRCLFLGFRHNAQAYLPLFDIYAMPSRSEGLPLALLEAAGNGLAIVCSDIDVFTEILTREEASFFALEHLGELKRAIVFAYENKAKLSANVRKKYLMCYTSKVMTQRYVDYFTEIRSSNATAF